MTQEIQERLQTLLQAAAGIEADNVTLGNFLVLDSGNPPYYVILPGPVKMDKTSVKGLVNFEWTYYIEVFAKFWDDDYEPLMTARQLAIDALLPYPLLNRLAGVKSSNLTAGDNINYIYAKGAGKDASPQFVQQRLTHITNTASTYSGEGDYA